MVPHLGSARDNDHGVCVVFVLIGADAQNGVRQQKRYDDHHAGRETIGYFRAGERGALHSANSTRASRSAENRASVLYGALERRLLRQRGILQIATSRVVALDM